MLQLNQNRKLGSADLTSKIRRDISNGEIGFGDKLPAERILAEYYSVSRGTVRSALKTLANEKIIEIKPGSGAFVSFENTKALVSQVRNSTPLELIDARFAIEPHICRLAILHGRQDHFIKLEKLAYQMDKSIGNAKDFSSADTNFHKTLAESTGNNLLIWIISQITAARGMAGWTKARNMTLNEETMAMYNIQHNSILKAIKSREPELAANSMKAHLESARLSLTRASGT